MTRSKGTLLYELKATRSLLYFKVLINKLLSLKLTRGPSLARYFPILPGS